MGAASRRDAESIELCSTCPDTPSEWGRTIVRRGAVDRRWFASGGELKSQATTVFLVDDDPGVVRDLSRSLRTAGHNVRSFLSSRDFLAEHDLTTPGWAVLGFAMPGLSGLELQNALATSGNQRHIIFMSRNADIASSVQAMKRGAVDFLMKPVKERALFAAVQYAIERDRQIAIYGPSCAPLPATWPR